MKWQIEFYDAFETQFLALEESVQDAMLARFELLARRGPELGRPFCDTLKGSRHTNMKELRCDADNGVWRIAFAFDLKRQAIVLAAGDKGGVNQKRFYKRLIKLADDRFDAHINTLKGQK